MRIRIVVRRRVGGVDRGRRRRDGRRDRVGPRDLLLAIREALLAESVACSGQCEPRRRPARTPSGCRARDCEIQFFMVDVAPVHEYESGFLEEPWWHRNTTRQPRAGGSAPPRSGGCRSPGGSSYGTPPAGTTARDGGAPPGRSQTSTVPPTSRPGRRPGAQIRRPLAAPVRCPSRGTPRASSLITSYGPPTDRAPSTPARGFDCTRSPPRRRTAATFARRTFAVRSTTAALAGLAPSRAGDDTARA